VDAPVAGPGGHGLGTTAVVPVLGDADADGDGGAIAVIVDEPSPPMA
jgi:hypothetical protein